jgi:hypothetical protein
MILGDASASIQVRNDNQTEQDEDVEYVQNRSGTTEDVEYVQNRSGTNTGAWNSIIIVSTTFSENGKGEKDAHECDAIEKSGRTTTPGRPEWSTGQK